ncbi:MAG: RlmE family RNA methyltransferase [Gammaproteobacteria bacterium]|nr:RlmE family RNA methyltransferase [Gammaproteobacteria bacterium]
MAKKTGKRTWMNRHVNDPWVQRSQKDGYRSRASYKLLELDDRHRLLKPGGVVVDLGAAPGGWSQVAAERVGSGGRVVALDLLPMEPLSGVLVIQADFEEEAGLEALLAALPDGRADLVLSDLSPNISGVRVADQARSMGLAELALELAQQVLRPGGNLVVKLFHGAGFDTWVATARPLFGALRIRKPEASRAESREVYAVAEDFQPASRA